MKRILLLVASLISACAQAPSAPAPVAFVDDHPRQIDWQRSLDDALALCQSSGRPLLVAMNMDGESASERIVRENYRDPEFVKLTRSFVCVIGSVFRHSLRDHDEQGRRIPCPRLGEVTCGEHIALEPILFDKYLGGERIAPRHALIFQDGTKKFDEFLLYDLRELDKVFAEAGNGLSPLGTSRPPERLAQDPAFLRQRLLDSDLELLARLDDSKQTRTLLRASKALVGSAEGPWPMADVLERSRALVGTAPVSDERPPADLAALERELEQADQGVQQAERSFEARARFGRVCLALARARIEAGFTRDVPLLLQDADRWLGKAAELQPRDLALALERAEASYRLSDFAAEERHALEALEFSFSGATSAQELSREQREALRWVGDAAARNISARSGGDEATETAAISRGAFVLQRVALNSAAGENDWLALASFHGLLGLVRHERAYLAAGALRLPESQAVRAALADACWRAGDLEPLTATAREAVDLHPNSAAAQWYLGVAWIQRAEWARRGERAADAIREYQGAERAFERCAELRPDFAANCALQRAACRLGRGFAHLLEDARAEGAQRLVEALELAPGLAGTRDGLDREGLDLLDQSLEWRASGPSPVDALKLLDELERTTPGDVYWVRALSDSELREARRAQHRGEPGQAILYCEAALRAARKARELSEDESSRRAYLLPLSLEAELFLAKDELAAAKPPLSELAQALGLSAPSGDELESWRELATAVRGRLGEAAPVNRPGR